MAFTLDDRPNFALTTLASDISDVATSVAITDDTDFPAPTNNYNCVIWSSSFTTPADDPNREVVRVTAKPANLTVTRAQEGTSGVAHTAGDYIMACASAKMFDDIEDGIDESNYLWIDGFYYDNIPANTSITPMYRGGSNTIRNFVTMVRGGSLTGLSARGNAAITAGNIYVEVYDSSTPTGLSVTLDSTTGLDDQTTQAIGTYTFIAGRPLQCRISSSAALNPSGSIDVIATFEVQVTP